MFLQKQKMIAYICYNFKIEVQRQTQIFIKLLIEIVRKQVCNIYSYTHYS